MVRSHINIVAKIITSKKNILDYNDELLNILKLCPAF